MHADGSAAGTVTYGTPTGLPPGMTFSNGTLSGTPTTSGTYWVNFTFGDGVRNDETLPQDFADLTGRKLRDRTELQQALEAISARAPAMSSLGL